MDSTKFDKLLVGAVYLGVGILFLLVFGAGIHKAIDSFLNFKKCSLLDCGATSQLELREILEILKEHFSANAR